MYLLPLPVLGLSKHPNPLLPEYSQLHQGFSKLPIAWLCFSPHSGQPWEQIPVDSVAEPRGNLPIVPWFMASRGAGLCLGIALICSSSGLQRVWDKHHPHSGRGTQPSHLLVLMCWRMHPSWRMIPASARTELLHQSKGMKLSPAF